MPGAIAAPNARPEALVRVVVTEAVLSFPPYATYHDDDRWRGKLLDFWDCVAAKAGYRFEYTLQPARRALHELLSGEADFSCPK